MTDRLVAERAADSDGRWPRLGASLNWLLAALLLLIPAYTAALGRFSRPIADDFCTAGWLRQFGFLGSQTYWYQHWSGRFSFSFLMTASQIPGLGLTPWMPVIHIGLLLVALTWSLGELARAVDLKFALPTRIAIGGLILSWTIARAPNPYQSFLWHTGLLTYTFPLILGILLAGWLVRLDHTDSRAGHGKRLLLPFAIALLAGGFSETYVAVQTAVLSATVIAFAVWGRRRQLATRLAPIAAAWTGSALAAAVTWAAPGNDVRQGLLATPAPWGTVVRDSAYHAYLFAAQVKNHQIGWLALGLVLAFVVGWSAQRVGSRAERATGRRAALVAMIVFVGLPLLVFALIMTAMAPSVYALGSYPDGRVLVVPQFVLACGVVLWGLAAGRTTRLLASGRSWQRYLLPAGGLIALVVALALVVGFWRGMGPLAVEAREFASGWDARNRALRSTDTSANVVAASLTHIGGLAELDRDPDVWVNRCVAMAYGLAGVAAK